MSIEDSGLGKVGFMCAWEGCLRGAVEAGMCIRQW